MPSPYGKAESDAAAQHDKAGDERTDIDCMMYKGRIVSDEINYCRIHLSTPL